MSKVETILSQLKDIAANPKKAMDDFKAETGKGAVGVMPIYAPEEMIHATGFLPMGLWGAQGKTVSKARTYLPAFAPSCSRSWNCSAKAHTMICPQFCSPYLVTH